MSGKKGRSEEKISRFEEELDKRLATLKSLMVPNCENVEYALDKFLEVMNDKEYQEGVKKSVELSYSTTYESMQRLLTLERKIACWDEKKLECLMKDSVPDFMRTGLDFTLRSQELYKEFASTMLGILERTAKTCEEEGASENILINTRVPPSPLITIKLGETLNLYFGHVTWSGGQVDLYISTDGYASLTIPGDTRFGPTFSVAILCSAAIDKTTYPGYTVGKHWIKGTIPETLEVPGGNYYIKAFDGATAAVAVTDNYFTIAAAFEVVPSYGPAQAPIELKGYALPANDSASLSYNDGAGWITIKDVVPADDLGRFAYPMRDPYKTKTSDTIAFRMIVKSTGQTLHATFRRVS